MIRTAAVFCLMRRAGGIDSHPANGVLHLAGFKASGASAAMTGVVSVMIVMMMQRLARHDRLRASVMWGFQSPEGQSKFVTADNSVHIAALLLQSGH
jgi:hypothetical protein